MARFVFKLEGVLSHRRFVEEQRQRELSAVQGQMTRLQDELRALTRQMDDNTQALRTGRLVGTLDMNYLAAYRRYQAAAQRRAMELVQKMALVQRQLDDARKALVEAAKQRKILEKLHERQHGRWADEQSRRENAALDEIGTRLGFEALAGSDAPPQEE